jgi:predicted nucleic acid-binding Zn ribbon protein
MPKYQYKCDCEVSVAVEDNMHEFERSIMDDEPDYPCGYCGKNMVRVYSSFGIKFNGTGFYKTDNAK